MHKSEHAPYTISRIENTSDKLTGELESQAQKLFLQDCDYFRLVLERGKEYVTKATNEYSEIRGKSSIRLVDILKFRGLLYIDESHGPFVLTRPNIYISERERGSHYYNGPSVSIHHSDIWENWKVLAKRDPSSHRAQIVNYIIANRGYKHCSHVFFRLVKTQSGEIELIFFAGLSDFLAKNPSKEEKNFFVKSMASYGFDAVDCAGMGKDRVRVQQIVLEDMLMPKIEKDTAKIAKIVTPAAARQYRNLALRFLTDPTQKKSSPAYWRFKELEDLL